MTTLRIKTLIVDDVQLARQKLVRALSEHNDIEIVGEADNGEDMIACVRKLQPQLLFLDITMPEQDGFSAFSEIAPEQRPLVIFVTAYAHYALNAFRVDAIDYLLKPVEKTLLAESLERVRRRLNTPGEIETETPINHRPIATYPERINLRTDTGLRILPVAQIDWIESIRNYVAIHCAEETLIVRATLQNTIAQLDPGLFIKVHRSAVVNLTKIHELRPTSNGDQKVLLVDGSTIPLSRAHREAVLKTLMK